MKHVKVGYRLWVLLFVLTFGWAGQSQPLKPTPGLALLHVFVTNSEGKPLEGEKIGIAGTQTPWHQEFLTGTDGKFSGLIPKGDTYLINYQKFNYSEEYTDLEVPLDNQLVTLEVSVIIEPPRVVTLRDLSFGTASAVINPVSYPELMEVVDVLKRKRTMVVEVGGHTDNVGSPGSNLKLSLARANAVRDFLISKGIDTIRVQARGYGDTVPVGDNANPEGRRKNRRTEIRILKP